MRAWILTLLLCGWRIAFAQAATPHSGPGGQEWLRMLSGLMIVIVVIAILFWLLRRLQSGGFSLQQGMRFISGMSMGSRERLVLVEVGGRYLLLGVTASQINLVCDFGEEIPPGFDAVNKPSFSKVLQSAMGRKS